MTPLWTAEEIAAATGGTASAAFEVTGVTFDSREVSPGDLFVAMPGTVHDGHEFLGQAFAAGAAGAIVARPIEQPHVLVADVAAALIALGRAARERTEARVIGVTGSVGKTSTKEALFAALERGAPGRVHRSVKSYNNHTGVPLSLARMPRDSLYAVLEMGMNNPGEIADLTRQVRPHLALVTAIAPAHIETLGSEEAIADAKAEIFQGLEPEGIAIIPDTTPLPRRLLKAARRHAGRTIRFGGDDSDIHAIHAVPAGHGGSLITAALIERELTFTISQRGDHWVTNALAVLAAVEAVGGDCRGRWPRAGRHGRARRAAASATGSRSQGGELLLIDESYNANPASMAATLQEPRRGARSRPGGSRCSGQCASSASRATCSTLGLRHRGGRREGRPADPDRRGDASRSPRRSAAKVAVERAADVEEAIDAAARRLAAPGDAVLVKASNSVGLARLVERL